MRTRLRRHTRQIKLVVYKETLFDYKEHCWTFLGAFLGIGLVGLLSQYQLAPVDAPLLIGSFGASSVLVYGVINSPLAQPRNLVGGHVLSAFIGVTVHQLLPQPMWLAAALAVALAIVGMQITKTLHPPGGATALIAIIGSPQLKALGYWYVVVPVLLGRCCYCWWQWSLTSWRPAATTQPIKTGTGSGSARTEALALVGLVR